jgi:Family of unknown function (DUF6011)
VNQAPVGKQFILGGRAILTMVGKSSRFTFRIRRADPTDQHPNPDLYFVSVMTGTDNEGSYTYLGILDRHTGAIRPTRNTKMPTTDPAFVAASWAFPAIFQWGRLPGGQVLHAGRCGRCARLLTDPTSIRMGFGPECADKLGVPIRKADVNEGWEAGGAM